MSEVAEKDENPRWNAAIATLLTARTQEEAAKRVGVNPSTLRRWQGDPRFQKAAKEARARTLEHSIAQLTAATTEAVEVLRQNLHGDKPNIQIRAAISVIELAMKGAELVDLENRVLALEDALSRKDSS